MDKSKNSMLKAIRETEGSEADQYLKENISLEPMLEEIELIKDQHIRNFVRVCLLGADTFWEIPSSFTQYHPPDEREPGGNVLHTKRVVRAANLMCDAYGVALNTGLEQYAAPLIRDMVLAACILHDITKGVRWIETEPPQYDRMHPYTVDRFLDNIRNQEPEWLDEDARNFYLDDDILSLIMSWVRSHMGVWSPIPETFPTTIPAMIVHLADNVAAHVHEIIDGSDIQEWRWIDSRS